MKAIEITALIIQYLILAFVLGCGVGWTLAHVRLFAVWLPRAIHRHWEARAARHLYHLLRNGGLGI